MLSAKEKNATAVMAKYFANRICTVRCLFIYFIIGRADELFSIGSFLPDMIRRFEVTVGIAGIVIRVSEGVAVIEKVFYDLDRDREAEAFAKSDFHIRDADDFAREIEQWPATVAGIDLRG